MKFTPADPPRLFDVGHGEKKIRLKDCGRVELDPDEQVTFTTPSGAEYDVARKSWGFYATPSLNGRLQRFGLRGVLVKNRINQYSVLLVERSQEAAFVRYVADERLTVVSWLDESGVLERLEAAVRLSDEVDR
ncbi:MAG: Uncharacterized protein XU15_C0016G0036 [candidate division NC10 bacterium CSP1-5]|nr:MAG: Uncharacterized protein XU15_C0016G0036 [candidate division NC10 bacterium CSP1-5]